MTTPLTHGTNDNPSESGTTHAELRGLAEAREWSASVDEHHAQEDPDPWICDVRDGNDRLRVVLAEVDRLRAENERLRTRVTALEEGWANARDTILNERHQLAEENFGSERINMVLGVLDDNYPEAPK